MKKLLLYWIGFFFITGINCVVYGESVSFPPADFTAIIPDEWISEVGTSAKGSFKITYHAPEHPPTHISLSSSLSTPTERIAKLRESFISKLKYKEIPLLSPRTIHGIQLLGFGYEDDNIIAPSFSVIWIFTFPYVEHEYTLSFSTLPEEQYKERYLPVLEEVLQSLMPTPNVTQRILAQTEEAITSYHWSNETYPLPATIEQDLASMKWVHLPLVDGWGHPLVYETDGSSYFILKSPGVNGILGDEDDLILSNKR